MLTELCENCRDARPASGPGGVKSPVCTRAAWPLRTQVHARKAAVGHSGDKISHLNVRGWSPILAAVQEPLFYRREAGGVRKNPGTCRQHLGFSPSPLCHPQPPRGPPARLAPATFLPRPGGCEPCLPLWTSGSSGTERTTAGEAASRPKGRFLQRRFSA